MDDIAKSLNFLIKGNKGEWKSDKQARFLLSKIKKVKPSDELKAWARQKGYADKVLFQHSGEFRGRAYGFYYALDDMGIAARAKLRNPDSPNPQPTIDFERPFTIGPLADEARKQGWNVTETPNKVYMTMHFKYKDPWRKEERISLTFSEKEIRFVFAWEEGDFYDGREEVVTMDEAKKIVKDFRKKYNEYSKKRGKNYLDRVK